MLEFFNLFLRLVFDLRPPCRSRGFDLLSLKFTYYFTSEFLRLLSSSFIMSFGDRHQFLVTSHSELWDQIAFCCFMSMKHFMHHCIIAFSIIYYYQKSEGLQIDVFKENQHNLVSRLHSTKPLLVDLKGCKREK